MCERFTIEYTWAEVHNALNLIPASAKGRNDPPRFKVCPTQQIGFVCIEDGKPVVKDGRWGLVPFWAKEGSKIPMMINARSETVAEKAIFKYSYNSKRCLIPASAFYEWTLSEDKKKDPHYIYLPDKKPFYFAGLWAHNDKMDVTSCSILTTPPHENIAHIHDRMPVILKEEALPLIDKNRGADLISYRVDRAVNKRDAQGEGLIQPL